jgi:CIC family chloride channel protein
MKKMLWRFHRRIFLRMIAFWYARWGEKSLLILVASLIGVITALAAVLLHTMVERLDELSLKLSLSSMDHKYWWLALLFILPMAGIFLSYLVQRYLGGPRYAKSLSPLILNLNRRRTGIPLSETCTHALSSALSVGLGGSAGLEAPSVLTGAAIGSNMGGLFNIDRKKRHLLLGCGAAAGISAIFGSPIAGVLFAAEVLLPEFSVSALIPMIMSSALASVISRLIIGENQFIPVLNASWDNHAIPYYFLLGIACAAVGVYVIKSAYLLSDTLKEKFQTPWKRLFAGGFALCVLLAIFPPLRGQGYLYIGRVFSGDPKQLVEAAPLLAWIPSDIAILVLIIAAAILLKVVVSVLTVDSGGDGGIFAPSIFIGAFTGFAFVRLVNLSGLATLQEFNFVAVGMCGVFTAVMRAPLTGIFLIAEVTGSYMLLVPLMIVSAVSHFTANFFEPFSIYRKALADNNLLGGNREQLLLRRQAVRLSLSRRFQPLKQDTPFETILKRFEHSSDDVFPVLNEKRKLLGLVYKNKIITAMLNPEICNCLLAYDIMDEPKARLTPDDDLAKALTLMDTFKVNALPVCKPPSGEFLGFIGKDAVFGKYRNMVQEENVL